MHGELPRRRFVQVVGAAGAGAALTGTAGASEVSTSVLDDSFDENGGLQESLIVFDDSESATRLDSLDLEEPYQVFEHVDIAWTFLDADQLQTVAGWPSVRRVKRAEELEWYNDSTSRESMAVDAAHELGYDGEDAHFAIIDSGINGSHPGFRGRVEANYRYVDEPTGPRAPFWVDARDGDTDELGHGLHCTGIAAGDGGGGVRGDYTGMAPKATITSYCTTQYIYLPYVVSAWNHLLGRIRTEPDFQPDVVSNSYGVARGNVYNPNDPVNVATWKVFQEGVLPVFAYGNDGEAGENTGSRFAKAPHVLGVGAAEKTIDPEDNANNRPIVDFSSRGRSNVRADFYDRDLLISNLEDFFDIQNSETRTVKEQTFTGSVGPAVNTGPALIGVVDEDTGSNYEHFTAADNVDLVDLTLSLNPEGQWVRMRVYENRGDDWVEIAQSREEILKQHDTLTVDVVGGFDYLIELEPEDSVTADYTIEYTSYAKRRGDLYRNRPITLFRPGLSAHGNQVMSSQDKFDVLGPLGEFGAGEPFYGRLSGTSMACPGAAGIAMIVRQAHRENSGGEELSPIDTIRVLEHAAADHNPNYTVVNTGTGFVDAEAAVETAEALANGSLTIEDLDTGLDALVEPPETVTPPDVIDLTASGSRSTDSSVNQDSRTQQVSVTIDSFNDEATDEVEVYDEIPAEWTLIDEYSDQATVAADQGDTGDSRTRLRLFQSASDDTVSASEVDGDASVTFTYLVRTPEGGPDESGPYSLGPAEAVLTEWAFQSDEDRERGSGSDTFGGTDTVLIAGTPL
ncbi:hypothetical protein BRC85_07735 [Halobacteriales archaeon QS_1_69_70]|nr:MAG: hypothetical protein BRC85_07735 [Halobacteriales archaeon QS_1_69_70]